MSDASLGIEGLVDWHHRILRRRGVVVTKSELRQQHRDDPVEAARLDALRLSGKPTFSRAELRRAREEGRKPVPDHEGERTVAYPHLCPRRRQAAA